MHNHHIVNINEFKSQKKLKEYVKSIINEIGLCESVKTNYPEHYNFLLELFKRHPNHKEKVYGLVDIKIRYNLKFKGQLEVLIEKANGKIIDISVLKKCINKQKVNHLIQAMRLAIDPQIEEFRKNNKLICVKCCSRKNTHVDHHNPKFNDLYNSFIKDKEYIPDEFDNGPGNIKCFMEKDIKFEKEWYKYHKNKATLRILCRDCNSKRECSGYDSDDDDNSDLLTVMSECIKQMNHMMNCMNKITRSRIGKFNKLFS